MISVEEVNTLPLFHRATIPEEYLDTMGHMNVRWYVALFDEAGWRFFASFGMGREYFLAQDAGGFALQQIISYLAEVLAGETVAIRTRVLGRSVKRIHYMHFMVNETTGRLASTMEVLGANADMTIRRTAPYPPEIARRIDAILAKHKQLGWEAPVSGVIRP
jgi:acyl-CoA thioester hydrolase